MFIFPVQLTTSRIGNLTRLIHTLLYVMTIHTYIHTYIHCAVVQQNSLVDYYCCFHLTSGTSTAVGPSIVYRNRKRTLLSQSTLREEFVEKKYQVFDIIGLLSILVQVNLSSSVERVQKPWSFGVSKPQHRCGVCLSFCT